MKKLIRKIFEWIFAKQLNELQSTLNLTKKYHSELKQMLGGIDISVDVCESKYQYSPSWAVISIQGERADYLKFMNLGNRQAREIMSFLRQYERYANIKIDASPQTSTFMKMEIDQK